MNLKYLLTTFIFDFAGLGIIWIFSEIHRTGHVIVDSENIENCFNLFDIIINTSLVFLINFCSVLVCRYFKIDKNEIFLEKFLNQLFSLWLYQQWSLKLYRSNFCWLNFIPFQKISKFPRNLFTFRQKCNKFCILELKTSQPILPQFSLPLRHIRV